MADKIAFCFCCKNSINNLPLWEKFFRGNEDYFDVYVHAADRLSVKQDFVKDNLITEYHTTWGDFYLAVMGLYEKACLQGNKKIILVSGACVPVKSFSVVYSYLTKDDNSYLAYQPHIAKTDTQRKTLEGNFQRFLNNSYRSSDFLREIDVKHWYYNETWSILNRFHAQLILRHAWLLERFREMGCFAYDENFPSYVLSMNGELNKVVNKRTTFANWDESEGDNSGRHPKSYESIAQNDLEIFKPFLFARKVLPISDILNQLPLDERLYTFF